MPSKNDFIFRLRDNLQGLNNVDKKIGDGKITVMAYVKSGSVRIDGMAVDGHETFTEEALSKN